MKPKNSPTTSLCEITIESLSYFGGRGVGRHEGVVVFVPGVAPGDRVKVKITARKPRFLEGEVVEILAKGPSRRTPPCPVADRCGGCSWQHVEYSAQIEQKEKILRDALRKIAKMQNVKWLPFITAPSEFFYRNRIQLQIQGTNFGFFSKRSRDLVKIEKCWIAEEKINSRMRGLDLQDLENTSRVELAVQTNGEVALMPDRRDPEAALFSQVNTEQNKNMIAALNKLVDFTPDWIMDLYCGAGNLTLPLAEKFSGIPLTAVELSQASIAKAKALHKQIDWRAGDVARVLEKMEARPGRGLIVLDPPRLGCDKKVIEQVVRHSPSQIVYVSCNPTTFARDVERLSENGKFSLESVQGLDMFPQTEHVELIGSLRAATLLTS